MTQKENEIETNMDLSWFKQTIPMSRAHLILIIMMIAILFLLLFQQHQTMSRLTDYVIASQKYMI